MMSMFYVWVCAGIMMPMLYHCWFRLVAPKVTVVGAPLYFHRDSPTPPTPTAQAGEEEEVFTEEDVRRFMELYAAELRRLYAEHSPKYNSKPRELVIT